MSARGADGMFRDEARLRVAAGRGGDGCSSFRHEKYVPLGGPDGGDGGDGGDVVLEADPQENSLFRVARRRQVRAEDGRPGAGGKRTGARGAGVVVRVPVGTQVRDAAHGNLLADLDAPGKRVTVAAGGRGGRGNARYASPTRQAPRRADAGTPGEERDLRLELKLVADAGLVGLPNAGKSTLLARLTAARPRVGAYPFTTLDPALGVLEAGRDGTVLVLADVPGLIEGAAEGRGLGHRFLRHVERTGVLLHLVDCSSAAEQEPVEAWRVVRGELEAYGGALAERPTILVATKVEDAAAEERAARLEEAAGAPACRISAATGHGLDALRRSLWEEVRKSPARRGVGSGERDG